MRELSFNKVKTHEELHNFSLKKKKKNTKTENEGK
jgi:hypothetical protein